MRLGKVLRYYRRMSDLDLRTLSKEFGVSAATLMRIEKGEKASGDSLAKIIIWLLKDS